MQQIIRILYVNGGLMNRGGIESYMMNYYRHIDRSRIQFDFAVHNAGGVGEYDSEIKTLGGDIYVLPQKSKQPFIYKRELKKILKATNYKIIHTHMDAMGAWVLKVAEECGVPVRIAHSHNTQHLTTNRFKLFFLEIARKQINKYSTHRMACSDVAGKWLFNEASFQLIRNAIIVNRFLYDGLQRIEMRKEWNVNDGFVIGHIGRFDTQKNHSFLLKVFSEIVKLFPDAKLMLIGDGIFRENIEKQIKELCVEKSVILTGIQNDVHRFYNAFDLFVLPSLFEGLPTVAIEAEVNGCPTLLSDQVSLEAKITEQVDFLPLEVDCWVEKIKEIIEFRLERQKASFNIAHTGYDINVEVLKLQEIYLNLWKDN